MDNVIEDPDGDLNIILQMPEDPRFEPPIDDQGLIQDNKATGKFLYEVDPAGLYIVDAEEVEVEELEPSDLLAVTQDEFEKEYEVK